MKYNFLNETKYDSDYFLKLAIVARHNSIILKNNANLLFQNQNQIRHGLFLLYTAFEELQKAIFCMFVHRGYMTKEQILPIFSKHEAKIILFEKIYKSPKGLSIENNEFFLDGMPLRALDFKKLIEENENFGRDYMDKRNDCLYARPDVNGYYSPSVKHDIEQQRTKLNDELTALNALFDLVWKYDFQGIITGFYYYKLSPKNKPASHHVTFAGGQLIERKNFRPSWVDDLGKELNSDS